MASRARWSGCRDGLRLSGLGVRLPVPAAVAKSIRAYPSFYRGGVVGPDAFPDIPGGQGSVHPDTRMSNGVVADRGPGNGYSFTWEWLNYICGACAHPTRRGGAATSDARSSGRDSNPFRRL